MRTRLAASSVGPSEMLPCGKAERQSGGGYQQAAVVRFRRRERRWPFRFVPQGSRCWHAVAPRQSSQRQGLTTSCRVISTTVQNV
jgi:hypothetical protein